MRRRLILTVTASVTMVLLAMLVPMAVLVQGFALEDRLFRAALEVQATETVVSGQDHGAVSVYLDRINTGSGIDTTVLYPGGPAIGPHPREDALVAQARSTGQARVDDVPGGTEMLVPVSLGGNSMTPEQTPVIRVFVHEPGLYAGVWQALLVLLALGLVLLGAALWLADRLGRSFTRPITALAAYAQRLGDTRTPEAPPAAGPDEVRELGAALNRLVGRVEVLLERERQSVADLSHRIRTPITSLRLRIDALRDPADRERLSGDLDELQAMVDHVVREARRSEREGLVARVDGVAVLAERARFWEPLAEDQGRAFTLTVPEASVPVRASAEDLAALLDVLLDNVFTHTPEATAVRVAVAHRDGGGLTLVIEDDGPGFPEGVDVTGRGTSAGGSTGLGLDIATKTATESGGGLRVEHSPSGGGRVVVELGSAAWVSGR